MGGSKKDSGVDLRTGAAQLEVEGGLVLGRNQ